MEGKSIGTGKKQREYAFQQNSRKSIANSLKTPALLFYKPAQNTTKKNKEEPNILHTQKYQNAANCQIFCENHTNIRAKYLSRTNDQQQQVYYCDKCAHLLMEQGFRVFPLAPSSSGAKRGQKHPFQYQFPERQYQISKFVQNLVQHKAFLSENSEQIRQMLINSQQFYGSQIQQINQYFQSIIQSLELQKNKCYNHILLERQNAEKDTRNLLSKLAQSQKEVNSMISDIQDNLDSVYSISWQNYQLVMDTFHARLNQIDIIVQHVTNNGIGDVQYRKIQFAGVPQSINSLSQIIIQNSYGSVSYTDGSLLLTDGSSGQFQKANSQNQVQNQASIFQRLSQQKNPYPQELPSQKRPTHMMFSFDGQKMRSLNRAISDQNTPMNICQQIHLRKNKLNSAACENVEKVEGIKEVQEIDVLVVDLDQQDKQFLGFNHPVINR